MSIKIVSDVPKDFMVPKQITEEFAQSHVIAYCTDTGKICRLHPEGYNWRFRNVLTAYRGSKRHREDQYYRCGAYTHPSRAIEKVTNKGSTRDLRAFDSDLEFVEWAARKLREHSSPVHEKNDDEEGC